jgi:hypothetical protein
LALSHQLMPLYGRGQQVRRWDTGAIGTGKTASVIAGLASVGVYRLDGVSAPDEIKRLLRQEMPKVTDDALQCHSGAIARWVDQQQPPADVIVADGLATPEKLAECGAGGAIVHVTESYGDPVNAMNSVLCRPLDGSGGPHMPFAALAESHIIACKLRNQILADPSAYNLASFRLVVYVPEGGTPDQRRKLLFECTEGQCRKVDPVLYDQIRAITPERLRSDLAALGNTVVTPDQINIWVHHSAPKYAAVIRSHWTPYLGETVAAAFALRAMAGVA